MPYFLDIAAVAIVVYFVWNGYRKGLILSAAGLAITLVSMWAAWVCASAFAAPLGLRLEETLRPVVEEAIGKAGGELSLPTMKETFTQLGFTGAANSTLTDTVAQKASEAGTSLKDAAVSAVSRAAAFGLIFIIGFIVIKIILDLIARTLTKTLKIPGLNLLNKAGGIAFGLICGLAVLFILGWALNFMGTWIPGEEVENSLLVRHFTDAGLFSRLTSALFARF
jgi:uncharacterized membrane protein required for colicin V production